jgi:hypothetical protein
MVSDRARLQQLSALEAEQRFSVDAFPTGPEKTDDVFLSSFE